MPKIIWQFYNDVELVANMIFMNDALFLTSISANIYNKTIGAIHNLTCPSLQGKVISIMKVFAAWSFRIIVIIVDI